MKLILTASLLFNIVLTVTFYRQHHQVQEAIKLVNQATDNANQAMGLEDQCKSLLVFRSRMCAVGQYAIGFQPNGDVICTNMESHK